MEQCQECGFDYEALIPQEAAKLFKPHAVAVSALLWGRDDTSLRARPEPSVWSAIEYACHVRDVLLMQRERIYLTLVEDTPRFAPMYRDQRVENAGYAHEDTQELTEELAVAANLMTKVFRGLSDEHLARHCIFGYPESSERDLSWVIRHTAHEVVHHEMDVRRILS